MSANAQSELNEIRAELQSIINELDSIAQGVRDNFLGIGNDRCAASISGAVDHYQFAEHSIAHVDVNRLTEEFAAAKRAAEQAAAAAEAARRAASAPKAAPDSDSSSTVRKSMISRLGGVIRSVLKN